YCNSSSRVRFSVVAAVALSLSQPKDRSASESESFGREPGFIRNASGMSRRGVVRCATQFSRRVIRNSKGPWKAINNPAHLRLIRIASGPRTAQYLLHDAVNIAAP